MSYTSLFCVLVFSVVSATGELQEVNVQRGQEVVLQCRGPTDASVTLLEWTRLDLKSDGYMFFYRNKQFYEAYQLQSFRGRVELVDPQVKDGDFSVVLKNVDISDSGSYECRVVIGTPGKTTHSEVKRVIELKVTDSEATVGRIRGGGNQSGCVGVVAALSLICLLLVVD
ncbi:coxsackievirus and adenovirus receptor homolog [Pagrus major]|uniref:coxsackievirus and adenovirus receptor homolog n=1 Tax=Pagrus major TaxID=143350 RepID=UPI003CC85EE4